MIAISIDWKDAASSGGWRYPEDTGLMKVKTIGWLLAQDKDTVTISTCASDGGKFLDALTIPRKSISKMKRIRV